MTDIKKAAVPIPSVGADGEQSRYANTENIIANAPEQINEKAENPPGKVDLRAISMMELYDTSYYPKAQIVDGLLYAGIYLFVGAPKIGKSFFMAQLGYHIVTGTPLWTYPVHKGTVFYLALEDDFARLQKRLSTMFGEGGTENLFLATRAKAMGDGLGAQLEAFVRVHPDTRLIIIDTLQKIREALYTGEVTDAGKTLLQFLGQVNHILIVLPACRGFLGIFDPLRSQSVNQQIVRAAAQLVLVLHIPCVAQANIGADIGSGQVKHKVIQVI